MMLRRITQTIIVLLAFAVLFVGQVFAIESRTGFIAKEIWTNDVEYVDGQEVTLFTSLFNGEEGRLTVTVDFYDDDELLGNREVFIEPENATVVSFAWQLTQGDHEIFARISQADLNGEEVQLPNAVTKKEEISVKFNLQEVLDEQKEEVEDKIDDTIESAEEKLENVDLPPVVEETFEETESFRESIHEKLENEHEEVLGIIAESKEGDDSGLKKAWNRILQGSTWLGAILTKHALLFYVVAALLVFVILKKILKLILKLLKGKRGRGYDDEE